MSDAFKTLENLSDGDFEEACKTLKAQIEKRYGIEQQQKSPQETIDSIVSGAALNAQLADALHPLVEKKKDEITAARRFSLTGIIYSLLGESGLKFPKPTDEEALRAVYGEVQNKLHIAESRLASAAQTAQHEYGGAVKARVKAQAAYDGHRERHEANRLLIDELAQKIAASRKAQQVYEQTSHLEASRILRDAQAKLLPTYEEKHAQLSIAKQHLSLSGQLSQNELQNAAEAEALRRRDVETITLTYQDARHQRAQLEAAAKRGQCADVLYSALQCIATSQAILQTMYPGGTHGNSSR